MKNKLFFAAGAALFLAATVFVSVYVNNGNDSMEAMFDANVEALSKNEIIVGPICMQCPDRLCISLGEPFDNHVRP